MQKIITNLWFDKEGEEAANFYVSVFKDGKIHKITRFGKSAAEVSGQPEGSVLTVEFELFGQRFIALNGGPIFKFSEAISLMVTCETQEEVDDLWNKLIANGGEESMCGWLKDKYGLSWQIVPRELNEVLEGPNPVKVEKAMAAMLTMHKLDIEVLKKAYSEG